MPLTAETLFQRFFLPLYPSDAAANLARARNTDANPARNTAVFGHLQDAAARFVGMSKHVLGRDLGLDFTDASVHRLGASLTRARRDTWLGQEGTAENELFNVVVHGSAYVGECIVRSHGAGWGVRRPLWESVVNLVSPLGESELAVFHWWLKSLADDAFTSDGTPRSALAERYRSYIEVARGPGALPILAPPDRVLPRIAKAVRYEVFHKYLKAHVPELRDLGRDFPSHERFEAYRFPWLDFALVGGGRLLIAFGPGQGGLHVFWLGKDGFQKSALFASETAPEPRVELVGDKLRIHVTSDGTPQVHEMMW